MSHYTIGIDISKASLDVHRLPDGAIAQFDNSAKGHAELLDWLKGLEVERIVYEPTGRYHLKFEESLCETGYPLCRVNPLQARRFAEAKGVRSKTDKVDARMLAVMGQALEPRVSEIANQRMRDLKELQIARMALIKDKTAAANRAKGMTVQLLKDQNQARVEQIVRDIAAIEQAMQELIEADEELNRKSDIICSISGLSSITAKALIVEMPELGTLDNKQAAALAGLVPHTRQSGQWKGKSFIGGGRKFLRDSLYMPAMVACRYNPDMKRLYDRLVEAGKPPKLAIIAVMRKLVILANTLIRADRKWHPERPAVAVKGETGTAGAPAPLTASAG